MGLKFRRQFPFVGYILDFYCCENKVCIEVNGGIHYSSREIMERDKFREDVLIGHGLFVINVNAWDVEDEIIETLKYIKDRISKLYK